MSSNPMTLIKAIGESAGGGTTPQLILQFANVPAMQAASDFIRKLRSSDETSVPAGYNADGTRKECQCEECRGIRERRAADETTADALWRDRMMYGTSYERIDADGTRTRIDPATIMIAPQPEPVKATAVTHIMAAIDRAEQCTCPDLGYYSGCPVHGPQVKAKGKQA